MSNTKTTVRIDSRTLVYGELKQSGGDPSTLFEILEGIIARRDWENFVDDNGQPIGSFRRFLEAPLPAGCGVKAEKIIALLGVEHRYEQDRDYAKRMARLRYDVEYLLANDIQPLNPNGTNQYFGSDISDPKVNDKLISKRGGTSREYRIAVLKRDAPDIAEQVINRKISAAEGIRRLEARQNQPPRLMLTLNFADHEEVLQMIIKHLDTESRRILIERLTESLEY